jgi:uncharacterized protein
MASFAQAQGRYKRQALRCLDRQEVERICREYGHAFRQTTLTPAETVRHFVWQVMMGNVAVDDVRHHANGAFTASAYCQARQRLPLAVLSGLSEQIAEVGLAGAQFKEPPGLGHRVYRIDGSGISLPDCQQVRTYFGCSGRQTPGVAYHAHELENPCYGGAAGYNFGMVLTNRMMAQALVAVAMMLTAATGARAQDAKTGAAPYRVDHDAPLDVVERIVSETSAYAQYHVEFNGIEPDSRVPSLVYVPKDGKAKYPAVLLQYGSGGNKSTNYITELGRQFVSRGFVVLTIDVPNRGERRGESSAKRGLAGMFGPGTILQTLGDYSRAIDYLSSRSDVDTDRIGYTGISLGAITGLTFVAHEPRVRAMASIVGGANLLGTLKVDLDPSVKKVAEKIDPFYHVAHIAPRPLLLLNAKRDQLVPRFFGEQLHKSAGEHAKKMWIDTDHFFRGVDRYKVLETVIDFMEQGLSKPA